MASANYNHSLPAPPQQGHYYTESYQPPVPPHHQYQQQQYRQHPVQPVEPAQPARPVPPSLPSQSSVPQKPERTRPKSRAFSFRSEKSHKSSSSHPHFKIDLHETSAEKEARRLHGKSDPTMALTESEPAMDAQSGGGINPAPLRSMQHKDAYGNAITDPDRSNPTRSRSERPLDTIRGFEAAIDGAHSRKSILRSDSESISNWNRRGSYYGSEQCVSSPFPNCMSTGSHKTPLDNGPRFPQESYYGGRSNSAFRPESTMFDPRQSAMTNGPREGHYDGFDGGPYGYNSTNGRSRYSRMQSDPYLNGRGPADRNVYPMPYNHRSYETVASGTGSGSMGEPAGYQTDPTSSDNSSIDRRSPPKRQELINDYGINFGQSPQPPSLGLGDASAAAAPPPVLRKDNGVLLRKPSKVVASSGNPQEYAKTEKRKSWFKRFSRS
ncbi:hypothetical protein AAE478_000305 [Parahypoxylon ruwenzoriense]